MSMDNDGIDEVVEGQFRVLLTAASQAGEALARAIEQRRREATADSTREAAELRSRLDAELETARASLSATNNPQWWAQASAQEISEMYKTARGWAAEHPELAEAEERMRTEVGHRFGVTIENLTATGAEQQRARAEQAEAASLTRAAEAAEQREDQSEAQREHESVPAVREELRADALAHAAEAGALRVRAEPAYDSAERREATARGLTEAGHSQRQVAAVMRADVAQARPASQAVSGRPDRKPAQARKGRTQAAEQQRSSLGR
ncbi:hypothetical protein [Litorihabitans aurantiacus]|uniref:Colicin import membrane protein n=1 Tax=Litorihabitans aurantiacus TaxID=1930061 RepID=A0AA37XHV4_9MICO|nr:hypothetical protein [Litorihabitans aurantiacus]GMA33647.1 hypothetical protein GCM10025875_36390 [Litorihabitans aurantiacus]GMA33714.1 hypothetical protein GCM10025875_37060 [Litorihabitans aurantiacus]GMA33778.1 hypothetical protein GCM10025875_37700 [Litorihabitans aurantiacus]